jgi:hypothetical protein
MLRGPRVHADFSALAALAAADQESAAIEVKVALGERQSFADAQPSSP